MVGTDIGVDDSNKTFYLNQVFTFEQILGCYVLPMIHSSFILYVMAAMTMRLSVTIFSIAVMVFVAGDMVTWIVTTLGILLCAPSFLKTYIQPGIAEKFFIWKYISMAFELLVLVCLVLLQFVKDENVVDCIGACLVALGFSGALGLAFLWYFRRRLVEYLKEYQRSAASAVPEMPSTFGTLNSPQETDITDRLPLDMDLGEQPSRPFPIPAGHNPPTITDRSKRRAYDNQKAIDAVTRGGYVPPTASNRQNVFNEDPLRDRHEVPIHPIGTPGARDPGYLPEDPPLGEAPYLASTANERRAPPDPMPPNIVFEAPSVHPIGEGGSDMSQEPHTGSPIWGTHEDKLYNTGRAAPSKPFEAPPETFTPDEIQERTVRGEYDNRRF